ncbi:MAG TPA: hypothetical protein K8W04_10930 [Bacteroides reticulotermitis]|nr:hypothetical protein [Bacteroides reticulotermitis]
MKKNLLTLKKTIAIAQLVIFLFLVGCRHDASLDLNLERICQQYAINHYAYFYAENDKLTEERDHWDGGFSRGEQWIDELSIPLAFQHAMTTGKIDSRKTLNQLTSVRTIHEKLLPENLIRIDEGCPSLFYQNGNEARQYMMRILRNVSANELNQFKQKKLGLEDLNVSDAKSIFHSTQKISSYMERNSITGFRSVGDSICDLYPTWFVKNTYQMASWYVFRINGHTVLWKGMPDGNGMILCLKFVNLGKTLGVLVPQMDCITVFDKNGNPDLLLSPFVVTVMKKIFLPNDEEIDYNSSKEQLCRQFERKKHSPYLPLYIKELLGRMRLSKGDNSGLYNKLAYVYTTIFKNALPLEYVDKTPAVAINYVSNGIKASRTISLLEETRFSVFFSEQRLLRRSKADKDGKAGLTKAVDFCWIENKQDSTIVWQSSRQSEVPITQIRVGKEKIVLPAGEYVVHYESNERHSFEKWLSDPPLIDDYGIRIYQEN